MCADLVSDLAQVVSKPILGITGLVKTARHQRFNNGYRGAD